MQTVFVQQIWKINVEIVALIYLDHTNKIINYSNIAIGTIKFAKVSLAQIFKVALLSSAGKLIVAHNRVLGISKDTVMKHFKKTEKALTSVNPKYDIVQ